MRGRALAPALGLAPALAFAPASDASLAPAPALPVAPACATALALTPALAFALLLLLLLLLLSLLLCSEGIWSLKTLPPNSEQVLKGRDDFGRIRPNVFLLLEGVFKKRGKGLNILRIPTTIPTFELKATMLAARMIACLIGLCSILVPPAIHQFNRFRVRGAEGLCMSLR